MMRCDRSELEPRPRAIKAPVGDQSSGPSAHNSKYSQSTSESVKSNEMTAATLRPALLDVKSSVAPTRFICVSCVHNRCPVRLSRGSVE